MKITRACAIKVYIDCSALIEPIRVLGSVFCPSPRLTAQPLNTPPTIAYGKSH